MFMKLHEIRLDESTNLSKTQIFKQGSFDHVMYGRMDFDDTVFAEFIKNFNDNTRGIEIQANYSHESWKEAAGWLKTITQEGEKLYAEIEWTEKAAKKIRDKEFKYISPEFDLNWKDPETSKEYGAVISGVALTNIPFLKGMDKVLSELNIDDPDFEKLKKLYEKDEKTMNLQDIQNAVQKLSEGDKETLLKGLGVKTDDAAVKALSEKVADLEKTVKTKDNEIKFSEMLQDGKVVPAQKQAFLDGDMAKFADLHVSINLDEQGSGENPSEDDVENEEKDDEDKAPEEVDAKDRDEAETKLSEIAKSYQAEHKCEYSEALRVSLLKHPKLAAKYNG